MGRTGFLGDEAIALESEDYRAVVLPARGGGCFGLVHKPSGSRLLREPDAPAALDDRLSFYGMPLLFPPNRIAGGLFSVAGRSYSMPLNSRDGKSHIHGILRRMPFSADASDGVGADLSLRMGPGTEMREYFPHDFSVSIRFSLSDAGGLSQTVAVVNESDSPMPCGIGFHTAIAAPFHPAGDGAAIRLRLSADAEWELDADMLPTGRMKGGGFARSLRDGEIAPVGVPYSTRHLRAASLSLGGGDFNGAEVEDPVAGCRVVYEVDPLFRHWAFWNDGGGKGYFCPEPMTWMINAPNLDLPPETTGLVALAPGGRMELRHSLRLEYM